MKLRIQDALNELGISQEAYYRIVRRHIERVENSFAELEEAAQAGDMERIRDIVHPIKGTALNLRIDGIHIIASEIMCFSKDHGDKKGIEEGIQRLKTVLGELKIIIS